MLLALPFPARAQQATKVPLIGRLVTTPASADSARIEAFRQGLRELSYVEGKNIVIEWRSADGKSVSPPLACGSKCSLNILGTLYV